MLIGIDIGGTKCAVIAGEDGKIVSKRKIATPKGTPPYEVLKSLSDEIRLLGVPVDAIGISCGSPLSSKRGVILSPPNLIGWDNVEAVKFYENEFHVPCALQNDANACALAEWRYGAGKGCENMIFLTCGTGFGAGLILDGRLYAGPDDMAGEIGHVRLSRFGSVGYGKSGSVEGFCSGGGIAQTAKTLALEKLQSGENTAYCKTLSDLDKIDAKSVADCAKSGDETAVQVYRLTGEFLGDAVSILVDLFNPEKIVIGSIYARCTELLRAPMLEVMKRECLKVNFERCEVLPAALGESIGDYAALAVAQLAR